MPIEQEAYGKHIIKSWERGNLWQARAFLGERQIGDTVVADDRTQAVSQLKQALDQREANLAAGKGADGSPSTIEYAEAFARMGKLPQSYEAMLDAHLAAPGHRLTATQLAEAGGYENFNAANLHYGKLGQMLAVELNYNPRTRADGSVIWTGALATWSEDERVEDSGHFEWTMRPQVVEALQGRPSTT